MPSPIAMTADLPLGRLPTPILSTSSSSPTSSRLKNEYPSLALPDLLSLELYHKALEDERQKIEAFKRELPFCMQLLDGAIEASKGQLADRLPAKVSTPLQLRCNPCIDPHLRSSLPGLGEFMNFKRKWRRQDCQRDQGNEQPPKRLANRSFDAKTATNIGLEWHWNEEAAHRNIENDSFPEGCCRLREVVKQEVEDEDRSGICKHLAILNENINVRIVPPGKVDQQPSKHGMNGTGEVLHLSRSSLELHGVEKPNAAIDICNKDRNPPPGATVERRCSSGQLPRKPRRCWSPELHQRFLNALKQLGGSQAATPKQIRELMNVEGLTNDEVKSHLQKFRLHMRRPNSAAQFDPQQGSGHVVVFGGIWVPPECGNHSIAATATHQVSELYDSSTRKSNGFVPQTLPAQDYFSNRNSTAKFGGSGFREHRKPQLICRHLMEEPAQCRQTDAPLDESDNEEARSESASLDEEEDEKTENHLERFGGFPCLPQTNEDVKTGSAAADINEEAKECDSKNHSTEGSSQRKTDTSPVHTTLALKSFLIDSMHLSGDTNSEEETGRKVFPNEISSDVNSSTVLKELDPLLRVANGVLTKRKCQSPNLEDVGITGDRETDLSIGCPMLQRSKAAGDNSTCP